MSEQAKSARREPVYEWQEYVENLEMYSDGGYHPVMIGDHFSEYRYRIVHKLGHGSYSTAWLAWDLCSNNYVALKILLADVSEKSRESEIMKHLKSKCDEQNATGLFSLSILDEFWINGPNGRHRCLVTEVAGCDVATTKEDHPFTFPLLIARAIAAQVILGIQSFHRKGVIHGDLYLRNIFFTLPPLKGLLVDTIYERYGVPRQEPIHRRDGGPLGPKVPSHTVWPAILYIESTKVTSPAIRIGDFGEAWLSSNDPPRTVLKTASHYLAPEATFAKHSIGFPADIWSLACCVVEILGERKLFEDYFGEKHNMIVEMVSCLGSLPRDWWESWEVGKEIFVENGIWKDPADIKRACATKSRPLALRIQQNIGKVQPEFSTAEAECLEKMLSSMLRWQPSKRATADDLMESEWMLKWGFPSLKEYNIPF